MEQVAWKMLEEKAMEIISTCFMVFVVSVAIWMVIYILCTVYNDVKLRKEKKKHAELPCHDCEKNETCKSAFCPWVDKNCASKVVKK